MYFMNDPRCEPYVRDAIKSAEPPLAELADIVPWSHGKFYRLVSRGDESIQLDLGLIHPEPGVAVRQLGSILELFSDHCFILRVPYAKPSDPVILRSREMSLVEIEGSLVRCSMNPPRIDNVARDFACLVIPRQIWQKPTMSVLKAFGRGAAAVAVGAHDGDSFVIWCDSQVLQTPALLAAFADSE
jgi:hypothetical protein